MTRNPQTSPDQYSNKFSRRVALSTIAGIGSASVSGCLGILSGKSPGSKGRSVPAFAEWAYPNGYRDTNSSFYLTRYDLRAMRANEDTIRPALLQKANQYMDDLAYLDGVASREDTHSYYQIDGNYVFNGSWDKSAMEDAISSFANVESMGARGEYAMYRDIRNDAAFAIGEGVFVTAHLGGDMTEFDEALPVAEGLVDAKTGEMDGFADASEDFRTVMSETGSGYYSNGRFHEPWTTTDYEIGRLKYVTATGFDIQIENGDLAHTALYLFDSEKHASKSAVEGYASNYWTLKEKSVTQEGSRLFAIHGYISR